MRETAAPTASGDVTPECQGPLASRKHLNHLGEMKFDPPQLPRRRPMLARWSQDCYSLFENQVLKHEPFPRSKDRGPIQVSP